MNLILGNNNYTPEGSFKNYVDKIMAFLDHLTHCFDIFYCVNVDKKWAFLDHLFTYLVL